MRKIHLYYMLLAMTAAGIHNVPDLKAQFNPYKSQVDSYGHLDSIIENIMETHLVPGVAACAVKNGKVIWSGNYGFANISQQIEVTDSIAFMLGSTSKTITGTAFMQLVEDGLIGLDDDINSFLPFQVHHPLFPQTPITPRMLLSHVSGIRDNWNILNTVHHPGGDSPIPLPVFTEGYLCQGGQYFDTDNFTVSAPATAYEYTNVGSTLIAYLIEVITTVPFEQYCRENIFIPLEMSQTSWFLANLSLPDVAMPYIVNNGNFIPFGHYGSPVYPCGFLRISTEHLSHYLIAFMQKGAYNGVEILDSTTVELMTTPHYPEIAPEYGLQYQITGGLIGHSGDGPGVNSRMFFNPATKSGAIVMFNIQNYPALDLIFNEVLHYAEESLSIDWQLTDRHGRFNPSLNQNHPNPFSRHTEISFDLPREEVVSLKVYDVVGKEISVLVNGRKPCGKYRVTFDSGYLPEGIYFYRLQSDYYSETKKMIITGQ